jgi:hypothetical protein
MAFLRLRGRTGVRHIRDEKQRVAPFPEDPPPSPVTALPVYEELRLTQIVRMLQYESLQHYCLLGKVKLFIIVLSKGTVDGVDIYSTHRRPFDLVLQRARTGRWRAQKDLNPATVALAGVFCGR